MSEAFILFKPTCSECGKVLDQDVEMHYEDYWPEFGYRFPLKEAVIKPESCPYCGATFTHVGLYKDLPYRGYDDYGYRQRLD